MDQTPQRRRTFLDWFLDIPEPKVTYLTKPTFIDRILEKTFLPLLPEWVTPNQITQFRLLTIPAILFFLITEQYLIGTILFLFSAFSDALDGALARTKNKITGWGTLYDPLADKLLIASVCFFVVSRYFSAYLALTIIMLEILLISSAYFRYKGRVVPAKTMGKVKMILQCLGIIFLLFYILFDYHPLLVAAGTTLYGAVIFALLSLFVFRSI